MIIWIRWLYDYEMLVLDGVNIMLQSGDGIS
jgi:hypothetical protein